MTHFHLPLTAPAFALAVPLAVVLALGLTLATGCGDNDVPDMLPDDGESLTIHTHSAEAAGIFVNAYLVETEVGVIAIDSMLTVSDARALSDRIAALGKPLLAVLITHGHPDHYNGTIEITAGFDDVPVVATQGVYDVIAGDDAAKYAQWKPVYGEEWPDERQFPTRIVADGDTVTFGGARFSVHDLGPGESHFDSYWVLYDESGSNSDPNSEEDSGNPVAAFVGDLVFHDVHSYVSDGHTADWLASLEHLQQTLSELGINTLYPGHGDRGSLEIIDEQIAYLELYRDTVRELASGENVLSEEAKSALLDIMLQFMPTDALQFLITLGADAVAAELDDARSSM